MSKCTECAYYQEHIEGVQSRIFYCPISNLPPEYGADKNIFVLGDIRRKAIGFEFDKDWDCPIFELKIGDDIKGRIDIEPGNLKLCWRQYEEPHVIFFNDFSINKIKIGPKND